MRGSTIIKVLFFLGLIYMVQANKHGRTKTQLNELGESNKPEVRRSIHDLDSFNELPELRTSKNARSLASSATDVLVSSFMTMIEPFLSTLSPVLLGLVQQIASNPKVQEFIQSIISQIISSVLGM